MNSYCLKSKHICTTLTWIGKTVSKENIKMNFGRWPITTVILAFSQLRNMIVLEWNSLWTSCFMPLKLYHEDVKRKKFKYISIIYWLAIPISMQIMSSKRGFFPGLLSTKSKNQTMRRGMYSIILEILYWYPIKTSFLIQIYSLLSLWFKFFHF